MKPRRPIPRLSEKKRKALGGARVYSTIATKRKHKRSPKAKARRTRLNLEKRERSERQFARKYGSIQRVEFVKSLACFAGSCHVRPSENAHIENGGTGRKANADKIIPLCHAHHVEFDAGHARFAAKYFLDLELLAAWVERSWLAVAGCASQHAGHDR